MKLTDKQWEWVRWLAIVALIAVFGLLNINMPLPVPATPSPQAQGVLLAQPTASRATNFTNLNVTGELDAATLDAATFKVNGYSQSGAVRFGSASTVISGTTIAHGFGVTPTTFIVQPAYIPAETYTQTIYAFNCGAISCTVGISTGSVVTFTAVGWIGGK